MSETMLQQTRVETVIPYYERFMRQLPTVHALAEAPEEHVLRLWSGLGYYRRARMLKAAAKRVADTYGGVLPRDPGELREFEGVGAYTAGAIASIAFGRRAPVVDGNVARVLSRFFALKDDPKSARGSATLWQIAGEIVSEGDMDPGDWNQALMELGATVCLPREPACAGCPVRDLCEGHARGLEAQLPRTAPRRQPLPLLRAAIVLAGANGVLLARRRPGALFGGLWEPPSADGDVATLARRLGVEEPTLKAVGEVVHLLSHRRMRVEVARGPLGRRRLWPLPGPDYDAIEIVALYRVTVRAQSALTRKVLSAAGL